MDENKEALNTEKSSWNKERLQEEKLNTLNTEISSWNKERLQEEKLLVWNRLNENNFVLVIFFVKVM